MSLSSEALRKMTEEAHAKRYPTGCPLSCESCIKRLGPCLYEGCQKHKDHVGSHSNEKQD